MYKVFIADDEKHIRILLRTLIPWKEMELFLAGEAGDGATALRMILDLRPDIMILDIRMPEMDGIEIIRKAKESLPDAIFILISGHREFEYAHAAIEYGVDNYLLKPINRDTLLRTLNQGIAKLNQRTAIENTGQGAISDEVRRDLFMQAYLHKDEQMNGASLQEINQHFGLSLKEGVYVTAALQADAKTPLPNEQFHNLLNQVSGYMEEYHLPEGYDLLCRGNGYASILLLCAPDREGADRLMNALFDQARNRFFSYCWLTAGLSDENDRPTTAAIDQALYALESRITLGIQKNIRFRECVFRPLPIAAVRVMNELRGVVDLLDAQRFETWYDQLADLVDTDACDPDQIIKLMLQTCSRVTERLWEANEEKEKEAQLQSLRYTVYRAKDRKTLLRQVKEELILAMEECLRRRQNRDSLYIRKAKEYIHEHCSENITLEMICSIIYINPAYFSVLFKKEVGINYSDYLLNYRMEKAKQLLADPKWTVEEVGQQVGYHDTRHFSRLFVKRFGIKPSEYRKLL